MAAEVPVIGTPVGGIVDFLKDNQTGFSVEVDNAEDLYKKIEYVLNNSDVRNRVIHNAEALIKENYSWENIAKSFRNIFDKLINT